MHALILANGDPPSSELARQTAFEADVVIATDGAANVARGVGLDPDIICGDFDSIRMEAAVEQFPIARFVSTPDQNFADLEKAIALAFDEGAERVTILGAGGGRVDHSLANYALLLAYADRDIRIVDERSSVQAVKPSGDNVGCLQLRTSIGDTVSLLSFDGAAVVSIGGVQWPLNRFALAIGSHGISNEAVGQKVTVEVERGMVLVCHVPLTSHGPDE